MVDVLRLSSGFLWIQSLCFSVRRGDAESVFLSAVSIVRRIPGGIRPFEKIAYSIPSSLGALSENGFQRILKGSRGIGRIFLGGHHVVSTRLLQASIKNSVRTSEALS